MITNASQLALWLRANTPPRPDVLTHLKLQKLLFYSYGAALAYELDAELGPMVFEAWEHGPVNRDVWTQYRTCGGLPLGDTVDAPPTYGPGLTQALMDVVNVYGRMSAWSLRQETHLEGPWCEAYRGRQRLIDTDALRNHFRAKFGRDVSYPEYLIRRSNLEIDGIPVRKFPSLRALSRHVTAMLGTS